MEKFTITLELGLDENDPTNIRSLGNAGEFIVPSEWNWIEILDMNSVSETVRVKSCHRGWGD